jgi:manganese/iron transport system substrate-binding protein
MRQFIFLLVLLSLMMTACGGGTNVPAVDTGKLNVVATTSIVADVVANVGGDAINVEILLPVGTDPHSFEPTPQDIAKVADADIVFANGAGLEAFIDHLLESADATDKIVEVSDGIALLEHPNAAAEEDHADAEDEHDHEMGDPHTWVDPNNVMVWVSNIETALSKADPANAEIYAANAAAYDAQLKEIDGWIREQIATIPAANRKIVTDHQLLGYYVNEYGLEMAGAIVPGYSSLSEPSAQELAAIEDAIRQTGVKAVFVGNTVNSNLAERVSEDTGVTLVFFYTGSLSPADGDAPTYLDYLRYNTNAFVTALK